MDGAIHRAGGAEILAACKELRRTRWIHGLPTGEAAITTGGKLPARYVIHTVGPVWGQRPDAPELLASCYRRSLEIATENSCRSIGFPAISTGVYGYPKPAAAKVASTTVREVLRHSPIAEVHFVFFSEPDAEVFLTHQAFDES